MNEKQAKEVKGNLYWNRPDGKSGHVYWFGKGLAPDEKGMVLVCSVDVRNSRLTKKELVHIGEIDSDHVYCAKETTDGDTLVMLEPDNLDGMITFVPVGFRD